MTTILLVPVEAFDIDAFATKTADTAFLPFASFEQAAFETALAKNNLDDLLELVYAKVNESTDDIKVVAGISPQHPYANQVNRDLALALDADVVLVGDNAALLSIGKAVYGERVVGEVATTGDAKAFIKAGSRKPNLSPSAFRVELVKNAPCSNDAKGKKAVGHRVVHGGDKFKSATIITDEVLATIDELTTLAPLHNPANAAGIRAINSIYPDLPQVAIFDTAFHQTMPAHAYRYAVPKALYTEHQIRRYGFHGSSHAYVSNRASELTDKAGTHGWIIAHLGNGCSATAVYDGKSLDTSMGITPLEGLMMGTRSGDVDPGLHIHLSRTLGMSIDEIDTLLNKKSGLLGVSTVSNDMRNLEAADKEGNADATLALQMFAYRTAKYILSLTAALPELTGIAFTGGVGENGADMRAAIVAALKHIGAKADTAKNALFIQ